MLILFLLWTINSYIWSSSYKKNPFKVVLAIFVIVILTKDQEQLSWTVIHFKINQVAFLPRYVFFSSQL